jgi:putative oxidoreductase
MLDAPDKAMGQAWLLLIARILMMVLFVLFGWEKLMNFAATANSFASLGLPFPRLATCVSIVVELGFGMAIVVGFLTRPLALLLAVYTIITGFIGHQYWTLSGTAQVDAEINFYKNVAIAGGFLLLYLTGPGQYSVDGIHHQDRKAA